MIFGGGNLVISMLCNATPPEGLLFFCCQNLYSLTGNFELPGYIFWSTTQELRYSYLSILLDPNINFNHFLIYHPSTAQARVLLNSKAHQLGWLKTKYSEFVK